MNLKPAYQAPKAQHIVNQCFTNQNQKARSNDKARSNLEADLIRPGSSRFGQCRSPVDREFKRNLSCRSTEPQILLNRAYRSPNVRTGCIQNTQRHIHSTFRGDMPRLSCVFSGLLQGISTGRARYTGHSYRALM